MDNDNQFLRLINTAYLCVCSVLLLMVLAVLLTVTQRYLDSLPHRSTTENTKAPPPNIREQLWQAPDSTQILNESNSKLILYGKELVAHTARYLGPNGIVGSMSNGMNCQNCHLKAGTKPFGNNYAAVASTYPKFRARSGTIESVEKRVNDCIERSLNGTKLKDDSREMKAFVAYITWVGKDVEKGTVPHGTGLLDLPFLDRAADPYGGKVAYGVHCAKCHGPNGEGEKFEDGIEWKYPPLHGDRSYNIGAGLYRISRFAAFVKSNMPHGTTHDQPVLSDEEAWDLAAYINSLPRPSKDLTADWPDISKKPFDHPFGPFTDSFTEQEHKFGPFGTIKAVKAKVN